MGELQVVNRRERGFPVRPVLDALGTLADRTPTLERGYRIAGQSITFRFFAPGLAESTQRAIRQARLAEPSDGSIVVNVCDGSDVTLSESLAGFGPQAGHDAVTYHHSHRSRQMTASIGRGDMTVSTYDERRRTGCFWVPDGDSLPFYQVGHPFKEVLYWILRSEGLQMVHAGAVQAQNGVVLFGGPSGSGKSTTTFSCLEAGLGYLGDDYVAVGSEAVPKAHCIYGSGNIARAALDRVTNPRLDLDRSHAWDGTKRLFFLPEIGRADEIVESGPIRALVIPHVAHARRSALVRISGAEAFRRLAPSTMLQLPGAGASDFRNMRRLVDAVDCYRLELADTMDDVPPLIASLAT